MKHKVLSILSNTGKQLLRQLPRQLVPNLGTVLVVAAMLFAYRAWAAPEIAPAGPNVTPGLLSYQGYLTGANGSPLNGNVNVTFRLYNVPSGGTALWTEAHTGGNAVPVSNGLFNVLLGSLTPIPSSVWNNSAVYLGVKVGSDPEMTPRELVGAVPVSVSVSNGSITTNKLANGAVTANKLSSTAAGTWTMLDDRDLVVHVTSGGSFDWQTLDLGSYVPATADIALVKIFVRETGGDAYCSVRPYGSSSYGIEARTPVANVYGVVATLVAVNDSKIEYKCELQSGATIYSMGIELWGYYEPGY